MIDTRELADPEFVSCTVTESRGMLLRISHHLAGLGLALVLTLSPCYGGDRDEAAEAERLCAAELPRWRLTADGTTLDTPKESVLRWTNPSAGRVYGNTYVWLQQGRPVAASCLFRYFDPYRSFNGELVALAGTSIVARRDGKVVWQPKDEWKWHPVPGAVAPAATAAQRLVQMRALAGEFAVEILDTRNLAKGEEQNPRLLPKPLYCYDAERTKPLDGALFAFVQGTDPELLLLLKCDTAAAKPEWRFGVGRMNRYRIRLKHKGETVWEVAALKDTGPEDPYRFLDLGLPRGERTP
jgi:hypothetical protein